MLKATKLHNKWIVFGLFSLALIVTAQWSMQLPPWIAIVAIITFTSCTYLILQFAPGGTTSTDASAADRFLSRNNSRNVGLKLQGLGKLSLAFEKFKQCPNNHDTANLLYNLAIDFQIKGEPENAKRVLLYISSFEQDFKDVKERLNSFEIEPIIEETIPEKTEDPVVTVEREVPNSFLDTIQEKFLKTSDKLESIISYRRTRYI